MVSGTKKSTAIPSPKQKSISPQTLFIEKQLLKQFKIGAAVHCIFDSAAKFLGNRAGRKWKRKNA